MSVHQPASPVQKTSTLEELVTEISRFEAIIADWDESQRCVVMGHKRAIEDLHKEALTRLIRSLKQESMEALRHAVEDEVVYGILSYHELVKPPTPTLEQRLQLALDQVRPGLQSHNGDVELVAIKLPDTVEIRLVGTCSNCPASTLTLSQGVEQAIKAHCPEITNIVAIANAPVSHPSNLDLRTYAETPHIVGAHSYAPLPMEVQTKICVSPDLTSPFVKEWVEVTTLDRIPEGRVLALEVEGTGLILSRVGSQVNCFHNACSHLGMPLDMGMATGGILTCLFHGFQYKLETGECLTFPDVPLQSYPLQIEGNKVFVQLGG